MRATDASISAEFQGVRLGLGDGLGGLAAKTRKAYWTADYFADHRFQHTGTGTGAAAPDLAFAGLVVGSEPDVCAYVQSILGPVTAYDDARGTDLLGTLEAYYAAGGSPRHTATALHIHVNTVAQRLERIDALLGSPWQQPDRALEIQLALRLRRLTPR
jgi:DNA-binding PucR family transcriptional regulator